MREIKFSYMYQHEETGTWTNAKYTLEEIEREKRSVNNFARHTLVARRQYTGLKDSKGVDIYEGDIVSSKHHSLAEVVFSQKAAKFCIHIYRMNSYKEMTKRVYSILVGCEVVGNIYENPESIEQGG